MHRAILLLILSLSAGPVLADIYTWKDASGRVHYSDSPPAGVDAKVVRSVSALPAGASLTPSGGSAPAAASAAPAGKSWAEKDLEFRQRKVAEAEAAEKQKKADAEKAQKTEQCERLRRDISMMERGGRIGRPDAKGEFQEYSDAELKSELSKARDNYSKNCS